MNIWNLNCQHIQIYQGINVGNVETNTQQNSDFKVSYGQEITPEIERKMASPDSNKVDVRSIYVATWTSVHVLTST